MMCPRCLSKSMLQSRTTWRQQASSPSSNRIGPSSRRARTIMVRNDTTCEGHSARRRCSMLVSFILKGRPSTQRKFHVTVLDIPVLVSCIELDWIFCPFLADFAIATSRPRMIILCSWLEKMTQQQVCLNRASAIFSHEKSEPGRYFSLRSIGLVHAVNPGFP